MRTLQDAFILDAYNGGVYVWIGKNCTKDERKKAMAYAIEYIEQQVTHISWLKRPMDKLKAKTLRRSDDIKKFLLLTNNRIHYANIDFILTALRGRVTMTTLLGDGNHIHSGH